MSSVFPINLSVGVILILSGATGGLIFYVYLLYQKIFRLNHKIDYLRGNLEELDHQARLIIKSDLELKLYQDAVTDKLSKLSFLKNFIGSSLNILDFDELFSKINEEVATALGFQKAELILFPSFEEKININFLPQELGTLKNFLKNNRPLLMSVPIISSDLPVTQELKRDLSFEEFLIGPIIMGTKVYAILCLYKCSIEGGMTDAEKEIFSIICMYLGQRLDNIKFVEDLYHAREELEDKIKEKTFALTKALAEMEKISKMKTDFISSVSHELRTPLTSVKGFSSLLVAGKFGDLPPKARDRLKKVDDNVNKLVNMVNTLLDISRIESKKVEVNIAPHDLSKIIKETADFLSPQLDCKNLDLKMIIPEQIFVYVDKILIERVLTNLINNAIKFTPQHGTITIKCEDKKNEPLVSVSDTGCGIPKDDIEKIFQEFYRANTQTSRSVQGSGLGLSLVKQIIGLHNQRVWLESELDTGTTVYFTLKGVKDV